MTPTSTRAAGTQSALPMLSAPYTLEGFRAFFTSRDRWTTGTLWDNQGNCCAQGHISRACGFAIHPAHTDVGQALYTLIRPLWTDNARRYAGSCSSPHIAGSHTIAGINNGEDPRYQQATPKARVLAAIDDLIALERVKREAAHEAVELRPLVPFARSAIVEEVFV